MTQTTEQRIAVTPSKGKNFMKGVAAAKRMGGRFDGQVWMVPAGRPELGALAAYSLVFAGPACNGCHSHTCRDGECGTGVEYR